MYLLVLSLLLLLCQNKISAEISKKIKEPSQVIHKEEIPFVIFICEYCEKKQEKLSIIYETKYIINIEKFKFIKNLNWSSEAQTLLKKQQETEYQIFGNKSWPPQIPFSLSPLIQKNGLLIFLNYSREFSLNIEPFRSNYILFYHKKLFIGKSQEEINSALKEYLPELNKRDGIRFYISKEVSGENIINIEKVIKNFTADKNSIIIPYEVTSDGIRYRSDIETSHIMQAIKQINQFVPNLSAQKPNGTNDVIEIIKSK